MTPGSPAFKPAVINVPEIPEHELLCPIASGAYGQVWLARNRLGVYRAVKIVHRASFDHDRPFEREFAGIKAFEPISRSHEGLVDLLQVGRDDDAGYFYYVMELAEDVDGTAVNSSSINSYTPRTLASELKRRGRLPLNECIRVGLSLAEALAYLHGQGLVHRDVKPSNVIFVGGAPKLADVGLVSAVADARSFVGTEGFIPPEGPGTPQGDVYSLGIVLYVLSTGKSHQDFPEPPADLSSQENHAQWLELDAVIHKACQADVQQRYQSVQEMYEELALLQRGGSVKRKRATQRRWNFVRSFGVAATGVLSLLLIWPLLKNGKPGHTPNPEAAHLYQQGQWYYHQLTETDHKKALDYLTQATRADPKFVQPYAELTMLYVWNYIGAATDQERMTNCALFAAKTAAMDPNSAEAHITLSYCHFLERDWQGAEGEIVRAIKANPKSAIAHDIYSFYLTILERFDEAHREAQVAESLEPPEAARVSAIVAAFPYQGERRFDRAIAQLQKVLELDRNFAGGHDNLGDCYEAASNYIAAIEEYRTAELLQGNNPDKVNAFYGALREAYDSGGQEGYLRKSVELRLADHQSGRQLAGYYALLGEKDKALTEIEAHFNEPQEWHQIKYLPLYDSLHNEPRFKELVKRAGLKP